MARYSEAQKRAVMKYMSSNTDDIRLRVPAGTKTKWQEAAKREGLSLNKFVQNCVNAKIENN